MRRGHRLERRGCTAAAAVGSIPDSGHKQTAAGVGRVKSGQRQCAAAAAAAALDPAILPSQTSVVLVLVGGVGKPHTAAALPVGTPNTAPAPAPPDSHPPLHQPATERNSTASSRPRQRMRTRLCERRGHRLWQNRSYC